MQRYIFFITIFCSVIVGLFPINVNAQAPSALPTTQGLEVQGLSIDPFIFEIDAAPGENISRSITLTNTTNEPLDFIASVNDFVPSGVAGQPLFLAANADADSKFSLSKWISITRQPEFTILPLGDTRVDFDITIPSDVEPGSHYGGILFGRPQGETAITGSAVQHKVGAIIIVRLGSSQESIDIEKYGTQKKVYWHGPIEFKTLITNLGNVHSKPKGEITIRNLVGGQITQLPMNRDAAIVLPESQREFSSIWNPRYAFGRYTAEQIIYYGNPKLEKRVTTVIWVIPVKQLSLGVGLILVVLLILRATSESV